MSQKEKKNPGRKYGEARSVWEREVSFPEYPSLAEDIETEVAVIGGGLTGILTGYFLYKAGKKVVIFEADRIAGGQTGRTTAKITSQHDLFYGKYVKRLGMDKMAAYAAANEEAIACYRRLIEELGQKSDEKSGQESGQKGMW